jgi:hypothetical protein
LEYNIVKEPLWKLTKPSLAAIVARRLPFLHPNSSSLRKRASQMNRPVALPAALPAAMVEHKTAVAQTAAWVKTPTGQCMMSFVMAAAQLQRYPSNRAATVLSIAAIASIGKTLGNPFLKTTLLAKRQGAFLMDTPRGIKSRTPHGRLGFPYQLRINSKPAVYVVHPLVQFEIWK